MNHATRYGSGRFVVDTAARVLRIDGQPAPLGARAFDVLVALIERRDRVVSKSELLDCVWPGLVVEENNLQVQISTLRKLLGAQAIATVPGRGYRFALALDRPDDAGAIPDSASVTAAPDTNPGNLPSATVRLIGREAELRTLEAQIASQPLVTVVGAPGVGKTTLALAAARAARNAWRDGVWLIELAALTDGAQLAHALAQAMHLSIPASTGFAEHGVASLLRSHQALLVLDNCEHLLDAVAALTAAIAARAPGVHVLVTSQELLNVPHEKVFKLNPLALPPATAGADAAAQFGAIELFVSRAQSVDAQFTLNAANAGAVAEICRQLDGLPLAIELAAARVRVLGVQGVRDRLDDRFRVLTGGARTAMRRHQTLHAALDWSHELLTADEQAIFRRLGVFSAGFTLELAQQVAVDKQLDGWAVLEAISTLVDKSLVVPIGGDAARYMLLESARAFALEKLAQAGETEALLRSHALALAGLFLEVDEARHGEQGQLSETAVIDRLAPEVDNLRSALAWACRGDRAPELAVALAATCAMPWAAIGLTAEAYANLQALLPQGLRTQDPALAARFWWAFVLVGRDRGLDDATLADALARAEQTCGELGWQRRRYQVLLAKVARPMRRGDLTAAQACLDAAIAAEQPQWPGWLLGDRLNVQASLLLYGGAEEAAAREFEAASGLLPPVGEPSRRARLILNVAACRSFQRRWSAVVDLLVPLVSADRQQHRYAEISAWACAHLVLALTQLGRVAEAKAWLREALPLWSSTGNEAMGLLPATRLVVAEGRFADAMRLIGAEGALPSRYSQNEALGARIHAECLELIEAAAPEPTQRERWRREGALLGDAAIAALCLGEAGDDALPKSV